MDVENLYRVGHVDPSHSLKGPWRAIEVRSLQGDAILELETSNAEYAVYILDGKGTLDHGPNQVGLKPGTGLTVTKGSHARLQAVDGPLRFFMISFKL